jgi:hypothetical protein
VDNEFKSCVKIVPSRNMTTSCYYRNENISLELLLLKRVKYANIKIYLGGVNLCEVASHSKAWVFRRSLAGIVDTNPVGGINVCFLRVLYVVR